MLFLFKPLRLFLLLLLCLGALFCLLFALLQSKWARGEIQNSLLLMLNEAGVEGHLSQVKGQLPFSWEIDEVKLKFKSGKEAKLEDVTARLAILPLFRGKVEVSYLHAASGECFLFYGKEEEGAPLSLTEIKRRMRESARGLKIPSSVHVDAISIDKLDVVGAKQEKLFTLGARGQVRIEGRGRALFVKLHLFSPDTHQTYLETEMRGERAKDWTEAFLRFQGELPRGLPLSGEVDLSMHVKGPWKTWKALLEGTRVEGAPLSFEAEGRGARVEIGGLKSCALSGGTLLAEVSGSVTSPIEQSDLKIALHVPDVAPYLSFPSSGSLEAKGTYRGEKCSFSIKTENLKLREFAASSVEAEIQANLKDLPFHAAVILSSEGGEAPFQSHFLMTYSEKEVALKDFSFTSEGDSIQGALSYDVEKRLSEGSFTASIQECNRYEPLLGIGRLHGTVETKVDLTQMEGKQHLYAHLHSSGMRYEDLLVDALLADVEVRDPFHVPEGKMALLAEKIYWRGRYFEGVRVETQSEEGALWPFSLSAEGRVEAPFSFFAEGKWQKGEEMWKVALSKSEGTLLGTPLHLEHPTLFTKEKECFEIEPLDLQVGEGRLHFSSLVQPQESSFSLEANHLPLLPLRCLFPKLALKGFVSARGSLEGKGEEIEGALSATLEEALLSQLDKQEPFRAKGTIQMHLAQNRVQIHTDLKALDAQFLDLSASLPLCYTPYPFSLKWDEEANASAELIAEGKLEDLFDFVNLGTNHFSGLLSCRLFLSHTLHHPSLLGSVEWQEGTYENDFTGIALKRINAHFEAEESRVRLTELIARDEGSGEVVATGAINLVPQENFPFHFNAEMRNLHAVRFDLVDCHLSGPLYLTGSTRELAAQGNLLVDGAKIHVSEHLPYDVSALPFTYIHRPPSLDSPLSSSNPSFSFLVDVELTAEDRVIVEGKGLNAELEGNLRVHGVGTSMAANGELKLVKGEYLFAGKTFKLTDASVTFGDKPSPSAYLNVEGVLSLPDVTITALMRGPLTSPQISFQSNPHKSTSSILALILFNKEISEINQMEAVQLASTLIGLSGLPGPNLLESIRKTLGVDRFTLSSKPDTEEISVQVGKYLMKGVLITLSQSATSSQVIVELELPKGFVFQAETQEDQEGKFSLKWRKTY